MGKLLGVSSMKNWNWVGKKRENWTCSLRTLEGSRQKCFNKRTLKTPEGEKGENEAHRGISTIEDLRCRNKKYPSKAMTKQRRWACNGGRSSNETFKST